MRSREDPQPREAPGEVPGASRFAPGSFLPLVEEAARAANRPVDTSRTHVRVGGRALPAQGWKLHVSAEVPSAGEVLRRALPVLLERNVAFKVLSSVARLGAMNDGRGGLGQVGKFITVYPRDEEEAVSVAVALDAATRGLGGPSVPSDRPLRPGGLVHYRYGGFETRLVQTPSGEVLPAISTPGGGLVPDRRGASYHAPPWARDPFLAAGVVEAEEEGSGAVGGRFVLSDVLYRSPAGAVHRALDMRAMRRCVLKVRRGPGRDHLRREAEALARLAGDPAFPEPYELVEGEGGEVFLAMEEVEGAPLGRHLRSLGRRGQSIPSGQVIAWGRELAAMLGRVHEAGLVYRDLKPDNVLLALDGGLRLVDFELACEIGAGTPPGGVGTRGYASPQRAAGEPPATSDDVYSLGALLYALATTSAPELAPRPHRLLDRPVGLLNPAAGPGLAAVISRCLESDSAARYPSMAALDAALAGMEQQTFSPPSFGEEPVVEPEEEARRRWRGLAGRLGDAIVASARPAPAGRGVLWTSPVPGVGEVPLRDLCAGSAGTVFALAGLVEGLGDASHRDALEDGARWLIDAPPISSPRLPGLYVGEAGVGAALLRAGRVLGDDELVEAAAEKGRLVSTLRHASPDLFNGSAGRLRFHLMLHDETGEDEHLGHAFEAGEFLLESSQGAGDRLRWTIPPGYGGMSGRSYLGYAHGTAGIADALLDLFEATHDERFLAAATGAGSQLARLAIPVLDDEGGADWPAVEGAPPAGAAWCHGATGVGRFFLHAAGLDVLPGALDLAARAARADARGGRHLGPVRCHGLAGNIEFLLDVYRATADPSFLAEAHSLARLLEAFGRERDGLYVFPSDAPDTFAPDYMTGYAGVATCMLRLGEPEGHGSEPRKVTGRLLSSI